MIFTFIVMCIFGVIIGVGVGWVLVALLGLWIGFRYLAPLCIGLLVAWIMCKIIRWG